jgi:hypothetical protein
MTLGMRPVRASTQAAKMAPPVDTIAGIAVTA